MKTEEREKLCVACEGRIPLDAEVCPYCASKQSGAGMRNSFQAPLFQHQSLEDSLTSLYTPPYQGKRPQFELDSIPEQPEAAEEEPSLYKQVTERPNMDPLLDALPDEAESVPRQNALLPTTLLIAGANFGIIGLMQLFFSKNGVLQLEWDANYWFFYCIFSLPLLYFGFKKLKKV